MVNFGDEQKTKSNLHFLKKIDFRSAHWQKIVECRREANRNGSKDLEECQIISTKIEQMEEFGRIQNILEENRRDQKFLHTCKERKGIF